MDRTERKWTIKTHDAAKKSGYSDRDAAILSQAVGKLAVKIERKRGTK